MKMFVGIAAAALVAALGSVADADVITVRSGQVGGTAGRDGEISMLIGPTDAAFPGTFSAADFNAADNGAAAFVVAPHTLWKDHLDAPNASANWIGTNAGAASGGNSALFSMEVDLGPGTFSSVILDFRYLVDNLLGSSTEQGLFLNGQAIAGTKNLNFGFPIFQQDQSITGIDVTSLVNSGVNRFYVNMTDQGGPSGLQFAATFTTTQVVPLPPAALLGFGLLGGMGLLRRVRRRRKA